MERFRTQEVDLTPANLSNPSSQRFANEGGKDDAENLLDFVKNDQGADRQFEYFANTSAGLTQSGLSRLNQSIKAIVHCVLVAQVNVQRSLLGDGGRAKEVKASSLPC